MKAALDANVILRLLTEDDAGQSKKAAALVKDAAEGKLTLVVNPPVLFEVAWTLRRAYACPREKVLELLADILAAPGIKVSDTHIVEAAIAVAQEHSIEFADAYIVAAARAQGLEKIATFNAKDFKKTELKMVDF